MVGLCEFELSPLALSFMSLLPSQNGKTDSRLRSWVKLSFDEETRRRATKEDSGMAKNTRYLGLDVHGETTAAAILIKCARVISGIATSFVETHCA